MARQVLEVADVVRAHGAAFAASRGGRVSGAENRVLHAITVCRTAALGGHVDACDQCGHQTITYNSCRNRPCPKCQASASATWLADRQSELLPVEYFHVIFTVPREVAAIAMQNKKVVYDILFRSSSETLREIAADPKHLGARIGVMSILHTWGQNLEYHPHVHCVVPGGGISLDGTRWIACKPGFFLPVRVLARLFRGKLLDQIKRAFDVGSLEFHGSLAHLEDPSNFRSYLAPLHAKKWMVYAKPPFGSPDCVLKYLARYTHRVAISNHRLLNMAGGEVTFAWRDYAHGCRRRAMTIKAVEFIRRFVLHVLPKRFVRIRHQGLLANRHRKEMVALCREFLAAAHSTGSPEPGHDAAHEVWAPPCPECKKGRLVRIRTLSAWQLALILIVNADDTS